MQNPPRRLLLPLTWALKLKSEDRILHFKQIVVFT